jgi:hypothetical protein
MPRRIPIHTARMTYATVDSDLFVTISQYIWLGSAYGPHRYDEKVRKLKPFYMAYLIIDIPDGMAFFWHDGDTRNNTRANLFVCTSDEAAMLNRQHQEQRVRDIELDRTGGKLRRLCAAADQAIAERGTCTTLDLETALGISKPAAIRGLEKLNMFDRLTYAWIYPEDGRSRGRQPLRIGPTTDILD